MDQPSQTQVLVNHKSFRITLAVGTIFFLVSTIIAWVDTGYQASCKQYHRNFCQSKFKNHHLCIEDGEQYCCEIYSWQNWDGDRCSNFNRCFQFGEQAQSYDCYEEEILQFLGIVFYALSVICFLLLLYLFQRNHRSKGQETYRSFGVNQQNASYVELQNLNQKRNGQTHENENPNNQLNNDRK